MLYPWLTLSEALVDYYRGSYYGGPTQHLRLGQYFCNRFLTSDQSWPELYYEIVPAKAIGMIFSYAGTLLDNDTKDK